ncbi:diacylglycerol/lipid kinase family protein [Thalassobellus sediminis]|uniref:diacylglycerol/lipid kinase family protein n=1 Tax=Thalassobellus sediminis TaxID=3367753 RepID=UPI00378B3CA5
MKNIHFIVNPIAGSGNKKINKTLLQKQFNAKDYTLVIKQSKFKKHATTLTKESINEGANIVVACGGDGTINEVARCLVNTNIILGIIPIGSGNGLASNLNIPKCINKAIALIKTETIKRVDTGFINNSYFFSNCGIGFDAQVIKHYETYKTRNLSTYIKAFFKSLKNANSFHETNIEINNKHFNIKPFMVFISNSNELGYNISLTPKASLQDGLLDVLIIPKTNLFKILLLSFLMLLKKQNLLKDVQYLQTKQIKISQKNNIKFQTQIDGESYSINNNTINISILNKALQVIA